MEIPRWVYEELKTRWRHPVSALVGLPVIALLALSLCCQLTRQPISGTHGLVALVLGLVCAGLWWFVRRPPRAKKNTVGFAVGISAPNEQYHRQLREDFLATLRSVLQGTPLTHSFSFLELPQYHAQQIESPSIAKRFLIQCRAHFLVYGRARTRSIDGEETHVLDLDCVVRYRRVPPQVSQLFSRDMDRVWLRRLGFSIRNDLQGFECSSLIVGVTAKHIIGTAALLSHDADYAESLFQSLWQELPRLPMRGGPLEILKAMTRKRLVDTLRFQTNVAHAEWRHTRDGQPLRTMRDYADRIVAIDPNHYGARLLRSIHMFVAHRDVAGARRELQRSFEGPNAVLYYNLGFLDAYEGDLDAAERNYRRASRANPDPAAALEVEEFICWILEQEPDKIHLHYCLGLVNAYAKLDYHLAIKAFEAFVGAIRETPSYRQRAAAEAKIKWCRERLTAG